MSTFIEGAFGRGRVRGHKSFFLAQGVKRDTQLRAVLVPACLEVNSAGLAVAVFFCFLQEMAKTRSAHIRNITVWRKHCVTHCVVSTNIISLPDSGQ